MYRVEQSSWWVSLCKWSQKKSLKTNVFQIQNKFTPLRFLILRAITCIVELDIIEINNKKLEETLGGTSMFFKVTKLIKKN